MTPDQKPQLAPVKESKRMVLLDANPLEDITNTQKIRAVVANGRYFDRQALDEMLAEVERAANESKSNEE